MRPTKKRILCVGDYAGACDILTALLSHRDYEVVTVRSPITALLISRGQVFHLYVLDAQFWGGAGAELCRSIRDCDPLAPVILFSSAAGEAARREAFEAGATRYVLKPDIEMLVEAVSQVTSELAPDAAEGTRKAQ